MLEGSGNLFKEVGREVIHYMRGDVNTQLSQTQRDYLEEVRIHNSMRARTVDYGLPGTYEGMVFADIVHKIKTGFELKRGEEFSAGVDVGHVSSAMTAGLGALDYHSVGKVATSISEIPILSFVSP